MFLFFSHQMSQSCVFIEFFPLEHTWLNFMQRHLVAPPTINYFLVALWTWCISRICKTLRNDGVPLNFIEWPFLKVPHQWTTIHYCVVLYHIIIQNCFCLLEWIQSLLKSRIFSYNYFSNIFQSSSRYNHFF
jgi:hypothetical protein